MQNESPRYGADCPLLKYVRSLTFERAHAFLHGRIQKRKFNEIEDLVFHVIERELSPDYVILPHVRDMTIVRGMLHMFLVPPFAMFGENRPIKNSEPWGMYQQCRQGTLHGMEFTLRYIAADFLEPAEWDEPESAEEESEDV